MKPSKGSLRQAKRIAMFYGHVDHSRQPSEDLIELALYLDQIKKQAIRKCKKDNAGISNE
jgi:hypothetical protein